MVKEVVITERAGQEYLAVIKYLNDFWTIKEIEKFEQKLLKAISIIEKHPEAFAVSKNNIRKCVFDKNNIIYYRIKISTIEILSVWAVRKNPKKLNLFIVAEPKSIYKKRKKRKTPEVLI